MGGDIADRAGPKRRWGARTWMSFQTQRLSVCLHKAVAFELNAEHSHCTGPLY